MRAARSRDYATHRQWALRTFLAAGGVYFFRLGVFLWIAAWRRPVGFDAKTFSGPFLTTLAFAVYVVVPLSVLQLYFVAQRSRTDVAPYVTAVGLFALTLLTELGTDIWIKQLPSRPATRLTLYDGVDQSPAWTRDGRAVTFASDSDYDSEE